MYPTILDENVLLRHIKCWATQCNSEFNILIHVVPDLAVCGHSVLVLLSEAYQFVSLNPVVIYVFSMP